MIIKDHITGKYTNIPKLNVNKKEFFLTITKRHYGIDMNVPPVNEVEKIKYNIKKLYNRKKS